MNKIEVKEFGFRNYGMLASEDIAEGEMLAYIPRNMIMANFEEKSGTYALLKKNEAFDQLLTSPKSNLDLYF